MPLWMLCTVLSSLFSIVAALALAMAEDIDDVSGIHATATEAVRDVGMDARTIRAVRHAHGDPKLPVYPLFEARTCVQVCQTRFIRARWL